jgi:thymidine phosphorylase
MIGQTARIAPADKRIYALRDVTATVESIPLIVASILSKKLAEGIDALVLDVKVGRGAFMKTRGRRARARHGARARRHGAGKRVVGLLTDMEAPLGRAIGNANETREAIDVLAGKRTGGSRRVHARARRRDAALGGVAKDDREARAQARARPSRAAAAARRWSG